MCENVSDSRTIHISDMVCTIARVMPVFGINCELSARLPVKKMIKAICQDNPNTNSSTFLLTISVISYTINMHKVSIMSNCAY